MKYLIIERKNDSLPQNIIGYLVQVIPFTLLLFLLNKLLFRLLSHYPCSIYFRAASFNGFVIVSLLQGNIEYFVFLGMRNLTNMFAINFMDKLYSLFVIIFFFFVVIFTFAGYLLLKYFYKKLFKYFLDNLFRVSSAPWTMTLIYCIRPFLKGTIHGLMYETNELQLLLLGLVNLLTSLMMCLQQIKNQSFKS